jgi:putative tricarboxylic transport membrane protein
MRPGILIKAETAMTVDKESSIGEGVLWVVIGAVICFLATRLEIGNVRQPGAGFVALIIGIFVIAMGAILTVRSIMNAQRKVVSADEGEHSSLFPGRLIYTVVLLVAYAVLMNPLGFIVSTFMVMFGLFFDWEKKNWFWSCFFSVATALVSYLVFETWLHGQLPRGILPWW